MKPHYKYVGIRYGLHAWEYFDKEKTITRRIYRLCERYNHIVNKMLDK